MKKLLINALLLLTTLCFTTSVMAADGDDSRLVNLYQCKLKEDKTISDVHAANGKWSQYVNAHIEGGDIHSYVLQTLVGTSGTFLYADSYPSVTAWEAVSNIESDEMKAIDKALGEVAECSSNTLHRLKESK